MAEETLVLTQPLETSPRTQSVDRTQRRKFVHMVVAFCLMSVTAMVFFAPVAAVAEVAVTGMLSLATFISLTYIGASSVDYNGGVKNMFSKGK